ncbi:MAG TPA: hypothetical protein VNM87_04090 [Candidatus Udaeobacter sp.]|nr:hypothetical protein [Candidatus Udaeobacter sp.]
MSFVSKGRRGLSWVAVAVALLAIGGGCARQDANKALTAGQQAIDGLPPEVQEFLAPEYEQVKKTYDEARQAFDGGNYKAAAAKANEAKVAADSLSVRVETRRAEFTQEWAALSAAIPAEIAACAARATEAAKKLPAGMTKETLADAQQDLEKLPRHWEQANGLAQSGQLVDAVLIGRELKVQCDKLMTTLGTPAGGTAAPAGATP